MQNEKNLSRGDGQPLVRQMDLPRPPTSPSEQVLPERNVKWELGYWRFVFRLWRHSLAEQVRWKIAWLLPRSIALLCFVRVCSATGDHPDHIRYDTAYKAWEQGAGR